MQPPRIVIVDDEPCLLELMELVIRDGFKDATVMTFDSPANALAELWRADPDALITDDIMPILSGYDLIESLMDRNAGYPILMVSGNIRAETWVNERRAYGLNLSFLPKPFTIEQLKDWLTAHLKR